MTTAPSHTPKKILVIADYGKGDLAFSEVTEQLYKHARDHQLAVEVDTLSVDSFKTDQTAALVTLAAESGQYDAVFHNTAPRFDDDDERKDNEGEKLAYTTLTASNGKEVQIVGVNSGAHAKFGTFSLLPDASRRRVHLVDVSNGNTQFRSRDNYPLPVIHSLLGRIRTHGDALTIERPNDVAATQKAQDWADDLWHSREPYLSASHGDVNHQYITVVAAPSVAANYIVPQVRELVGGRAEIDLITTRSPHHGVLESAFAVAQLGLNTSFGDRRTFLVLPEGEPSLDGIKTLYEARLDTGARIFTTDLQAFYYAKRDGRIAGDVVQIDGAKFAADADGILTVSGHRSAVSQALLDQRTSPIVGFTPAYRDGYGNVKLSSTFEALQQHFGIPELGEGDRAIIDVLLRGTDRDPVRATIANGIFGVKQKNWVIAAGSSGWPSTPGGTDKSYFAELSLRGSNAAAALGDIHVGTPLDLNFKGVLKGEPGPNIGDAHVTQPKHKGVQL